jgi:hypothetical protein
VKAHKQQALDEFWTRENETPTGIHRRLFTLYGEDNYGHKYCVSLGNESEGQWQKFGPEGPAAFWNASLRNPRFEQTKIRGINSRKSTKIIPRLT